MLFHVLLCAHSGSTCRRERGGRWASTISVTILHWSKAMAWGGLVVWPQWPPQLEGGYYWVHMCMLSWPARASVWVFYPNLVSCLPSGEQVALKMAGTCISWCVMNTADCGACSNTVTFCTDCRSVWGLCRHPIFGAMYGHCVHTWQSVGPLLCCITRWDYWVSKPVHSPTMSALAFWSALQLFVEEWVNFAQPKDCLLSLVFASKIDSRIWPISCRHIYTHHTKVSAPIRNYPYPFINFLVWGSYSTMYGKQMRMHGKFKVCHYSNYCHFWWWLWRAQQALLHTVTLVEFVVRACEGAVL